MHLSAGCAGTPTEAMANLLAFAAVAGVIGSLALPVPAGSAVPVAAWIPQVAVASAELFEASEPAPPSSVWRRVSTPRSLGAAVSSPDLPAAGARPKAEADIEVERGIGISANSIVSGEFGENRSASDKNDFWISCNPESVVKRTACDAYDAAAPR